MRTRIWVAAAATLGAAVTLALNGASLFEVDQRGAPLRVAIEVTAAMASIIAAQLVYGRFRSTLQIRDLVLLLSLCLFAVTNLLFSAVPMLTPADPGSFRAWAAVLGCVVSTALLAVAGLSGDRLLRRPKVALARALAAGGATMVIVAVAALVLGDVLPASEDSGRAGIVIGQGLATGLFAAAAVSFAVRAEHTFDDLARWLAVGATLGAFARLSFALSPSLGAEWFYTGDLLRLGCFGAVFAGAVHETTRLQRALATSAVVDERHRIARNLHDGVAQDLAFVVQQLRRLAGHDDRPPGLDRLVGAAERALDESRHAVAALARPADRSLGEMLELTAREAGEREGCTVETDLEDGVAVPARTHAELLRVVREAVINAARHGQADRISVRLRDRPMLCITVTDDGRGFDTDLTPVGRMGLASMHARVHAIGGELAITSVPGRGTEVRVTLP